MTLVASAAAAFLGLMLARPARLRATFNAVAPGQGAEAAALQRLRAPLTALAFVGGWTFIGAWPGAAAGAVLAVFAWRVLGSVESPAVRRRREQLERDLPFAIHLLGACLIAGSAVARALDDVASAVAGPVADEFTLVRNRLLLGVDPEDVWAALDGPLTGLGQCMSRAARSGSSVRDAVERLSDDLRADAGLRAEALARTVEVRAAAPLGVCFLPAFVILGIVPMIAGIFSSLQIF
ncbi:MAG: Bacterial type secretion system protein domain protein [Marmoricola sp.]|nr:Bacterial type secretion system protein domain protein [Marmoricola sp.]